MNGIILGYTKEITLTGSKVLNRSLNVRLNLCRIYLCFLHIFAHF